MKQIATLLKALIVLGTILSGLSMLLVGIAGMAARVQHTYLTLAAIAFPFLAWGAALFWFLSLVTLQWKSLLFQTLCFALSLPMLLQTFGFHISQPRQPDGSFRVMSYNVSGFNDQQGKPAEMLRYIRSKAPDIICFQEFSARPEKYGYTLEQICDSLPEYPYYHFHNHHTTRFHSGVGTAIFSKFPITSVEPIPYESRINSSCLYRISIQGKIVTLINNHLESNGLSEMDIHFIRKLVKNCRFDYFPLVDEVVKEKIAVAAQKRLSQARQITEIARQSGGEYVILCGDINDTPLSPTLRLLREHYTDAFVKAGRGMGATHRMVRSGLRIDYLLHSPAMIPHHFETGKVFFSDHYPASCSFTLQ